MKLLALVVDVKLLTMFVSVLPSAAVSEFIFVEVSPANSDETLLTTLVLLVVSPLMVLVLSYVLVSAAASAETLLVTSVLLSVLLSFCTVMLFFTLLVVVMSPSAFTVVVT